MIETNIEEFRQSIINLYTDYACYMHNFDISWCDDGIRRAKEAKTIEELKKLMGAIERAWDLID